MNVKNDVVNVHEHKHNVQSVKESHSKIEISICCDCAYCGDRFDFPDVPGLVDTSNGGLIKHYYCTNPCCKFYQHDITSSGITVCYKFDEF